jgi:hypothetical protein
VAVLAAVVAVIVGSLGGRRGRRLFRRPTGDRPAPASVAVGAWVMPALSVALLFVLVNVVMFNAVWGLPAGAAVTLLALCTLCGAAGLSLLGGVPAWPSPPLPASAGQRWRGHAGATPGDR